MKPKNILNACLVLFNPWAIMSMEQPFIYHALEPGCTDPVTIISNDAKTRWQLNRDTLLQSNVLAHQAEFQPRLATFILPPNITVEKITTFFSHLIKRKQVQNNPEKCTQLLESSTIDTLADLICIADQLYTPAFLKDIITQYNRKYNEPRCIERVLKTGLPAHIFPDPQAVAADNLAQESELLWFWIGTSNADKNRTLELGGLAAYPPRYFAFLGKKIITSEGNVYEGNKKVDHIHTITNNGCAGNGALCYLGYHERYHHTLGIITEKLKIIQKIPVDMLRGVHAVALSSSGKQLAACDGRNPVVFLIDTSTKAQTELPQNDVCDWLDFSPDESLLLIALGKLGIINLWDLKAKKITHSFILRKEEANGTDLGYATFSPDGSKIMTTDNKITIFDVAAKKSCLTIESPHERLLAARYNHKGDLIASTHPLQVYLWDASSGALLARFPNDAIYIPSTNLSTEEIICPPAIFSPDDQQCVTYPNAGQRTLLFNQLPDLNLKRILETKLLPEQVTLLVYLRSQIQKKKTVNFEEYPGLKTLIKNLPAEITKLVLPHLTKKQVKELN